MQARFLLGPAGSGKTFRCLAEIRRALAADSDGPPLLLIAPKQTTYQLERQLLMDPSLSGWTRLRILSFERLADFIFLQLKKPPPNMLGEEGRLMVLRGLLAKKRDELKLFRASARLTGFAQHLSEALRELQRNQLTPESLLKLAEHTQSVAGLSEKLHDLAGLLRNYLDWLQAHGLEDADHLLDFATLTLRAPHPLLRFGGLWLDGFTELSPQELDLLAELLPHAASATLTFCLDHIPTETISSLSTWSVVRQMFQQCRERLGGLPDCEFTTELLARDARHGRFMDNPVLGRLERHWADTLPPVDSDADRLSLRPALRIAACATPEAEAVLAAREILRFARTGGRYRETTVLVRQLEGYHAALASVFTRYEIPFFLDRRESVSHHPLAELTRNALRTVAFGWQHDDWFAALKTGLVPVAETDIDRLENEALARGWKGSLWQQPITNTDPPELAPALESVRKKIVPPFQKLNQEIGVLKNRPTGAQLAAALRKLWQALNVEETLRDWAAQETGPQPIHATVWDQMGAWLENLELAFPVEALPLREWLPILDAGLANLSVGVIPPALDQVFIGAIDRSRNLDIWLALMLGMNETVFPAPPKASVLLTDTDRDALEKQGVSLGTSTRRQIGQERFHGYVACTRARQRLVLTHGLADSHDKQLNPSPFLARVQQIFPALQTELFPRKPDWRKSEHATELVEPLLRLQIQSDAIPNADAAALTRLATLPALAALRERLRHFTSVPPAQLSPALAAQLYGPALRTSVSRMEQFAACPFKFFVHSGLRAEERRKFELDTRDQGNFQHEILAIFHEQLREEHKRWRDITPAEARERIKRIADVLMVEYREGLLHATEQNRFTSRVLTGALQDFVETLIGWMRQQYAFDPVEVELPFQDGDGPFPAWKLDLGDGRQLRLQGRIDRIDICREGDADEALCVVVDYKSSQKQLDPLLMEHGLQLQLPAYLGVLRHWPDPRPLFGVGRLIPAGVFYVNLRGRYDRGNNRDEALSDVESARKLAYRHTGRFDAGALARLDRRTGVTEGDQFNYRLNKDGSISGSSREALDSGAFAALLDGVEASLIKMGRGIYAGEAGVDPYRKGRVTACDQCDYRAICRIDPWTHSYRVLKKAAD